MTRGQKQSASGVSDHTCADKHDVILAVLCLHPVHHNLSQLVRSVGLHEHGPAQGGIHGPPHQRVVTGKLQHRVGEILGAAKLSAGLIGDFTRALRRRRAEGVSKILTPFVVKMLAD